MLQVASGSVCLEQLEQKILTDDDLIDILKTMPGIGPFSAANMLQHLGRYQRIACDSETVRHLKAHHEASQCTAANCAVIASEVIIQCS